MLTDTNKREQLLHDEYYGSFVHTDEELRASTAPTRLRLYRENPVRGSSPKQYQFFLLGDLRGKVVCDYACGDGADSVLLAHNGAKEVLAFDISNSAVRVSQRRASVCGLGDRITTQVDNAELMSYASHTFDAIHGGAILHHLDIEKAAKEIARVLKVGGRAVFREPFSQSRGLSAIIGLIFRISPLRPDAVTPQRQLNDGDIALLRSIFATVNVTAFGLFNRLDRIIRSERFINHISLMDTYLLKRIPFLRRYARIIVIECIK